jgi:hypothetical protein
LRVILLELGKNLREVEKGVRNIEAISFEKNCCVYAYNE